VDDVTALALAARDGDHVVLSDFIRGTWVDVGRLAAALVGPDLAEDATQNTYVRALRALPAYRAESGARTWLLAIARHAAVDALRGAARRRRLSHLLAGRTGAGGSDQVPPADGVLTHQALSRLDLDPRIAFVLTQLMGSDHAGAAEVCSCPVGTICSRVARARTQLVAEMGLVEAGGGTGGAEPGAGGAVVAEPDEPPVRP
jgi:RNA polymerase sigma-70 factor, ECF subfamily